MKIAIIGGGIGGLSTAHALHKIGIQAHVYERASSFKPLGTGIGIGSNAVLALQQIGVAEDIIKAGNPLYEQLFLDEQFNLLNTIDFSILKDKFGEENIAIQRADLHEALYLALDMNHIHFHHEVTAFTQREDCVEVTFNQTNKQTFDYIIAADGIHSMFRQQLVPNSKPRYAGYTCWRGTTKNKGDVPLHISSEAWSKQGRFGWAALKNGEAYWFAVVNATEKDEYYASLGQEGVARLFAHFPDPVERLIKECKQEVFLHHDIYDIKPLKSFVYNRIVLLGDAAHATTPNMGQGAGQSIEDAYELMLALVQEPTIHDAFAHYDKRRVKKTKKVIERSRKIGNAAQWNHPLFIGFRNTLFPRIPKTLLFRQLNFLFK